MKKYLVLALLFASSLAYSQKNDTCDYFSVGVYGGYFVGDAPLYAKNNFINSVVLEMEYRKTKDFSFFVNVLYQFTNNDLKHMFPEIDNPKFIDLKNPDTFRGIITMGGRYYLRSENINPYVHLGLCEIFDYASKYSYYEINPNTGNILWTNKGFHYNKMAVVVGTGMNFKINRRLIIDFQYNMSQFILRGDNDFMNHSIYGGLKYNLF